MKSTCKELWGLWKTSCNWDEMTIGQKLILVWWCLSFIFICGEGPFWVMALSVLNFGASTASLIKYVPEPKDED